jgi:hypothetical protein
MVPKTWKMVPNGTQNLEEPALFFRLHFPLLIVLSGYLIFHCISYCIYRSHDWILWSTRLQYAPPCTFQRHVQPQGHSAAGRIISMEKIPVTPSGIAPATFRHVVRCLNQLRRCVPSLCEVKSCNLGDGTQNLKDGTQWYPKFERWYPWYPKFRGSRSLLQASFSTTHRPE